jgi:hypothetical protein
MRRKRISKSRRKAVFIVSAVIAVTLSFNAGLLTDYFFVKGASKFKCATLAISGDENTKARYVEDTLIIQNPTDVKCYETASRAEKSQESQRGFIPSGPIAER